MNLAVSAVFCWVFVLIMRLLAINPKRVAIKIILGPMNGEGIRVSLSFAKSEAMPLIGRTLRCHGTRRIKKSLVFCAVQSNPSFESAVSLIAGGCPRSRLVSRRARSSRLDFCSAEVSGFLS
ncbi:hypothetical protein D3C81_1838730 [compost metagenome]